MPKNQRFKKTEVRVVSVSDSPICKEFTKYANELDDKHDRFERITKLSRDITIESKRIIFLLHTIDPCKKNAENVLPEAKDRLDKLCNYNFKLIANELKDLDQFQYVKAYYPGLQEFVESLTYYEFCLYNSKPENKKNKMSDWTDVQQKLQYKLVDDDSKEIHCLVDPTEFMLGLGDLTGELMRKCINSLGSGDINECYLLCRILQDFYTHYNGLNIYHRELFRKLQTMKQSVLKVENVCYNIKVRSEEAEKRGTPFDPRGVTANVSTKNEDIDEGFY